MAETPSASTAENIDKETGGEDGGAEAEPVPAYSSPSSETFAEVHPRSKYYRNPPNFTKLGELYPAFAAHLKRVSDTYSVIDWTNHDALRELTTALLDHDYGVKVDLPPDQLCPTVTLRVNYIHWLEDLLQERDSIIAGPSTPKSQVFGIDIGCGASCIYPLLGVAIHPNSWNFLTSEVDPVSIDWATKNVARNSWQNRIIIRHQPDPSQIFNNILDPSEPDASGSSIEATAAFTAGKGQRYDFCMCNPPFFTTVEEKLPRNDTTCLATATELSFGGGGEVALIKQMVRDSLVLTDRIWWYTSMLGKRSSMKEILQYLKQNKVVNVRTTEFRQGRTTRWAVAWTLALPDTIDPLLLAGSSDNTRAPPAKRAKLAAQAAKPKPKAYKLQISWTDKPVQLMNTINAALHSCGVVVSKGSGGSEFNLAGVLTMESLLAEQAAEFVIDHFSTQIGATRSHQFQLALALSKRQPDGASPTSPLHAKISEQRAVVLEAIHKQLLAALAGHVG